MGFILEKLNKERVILIVTLIRCILQKRVDILL